MPTESASMPALTASPAMPDAASSDAAPNRTAPARTASIPPLRGGPTGRQIRPLTGRQKAAILVRLLLSEGADLRLADLPEDMQADLTEQIGRMRLVDRDTLAAVVTEFVETLEQVGLSFPGGLDGALAALDGKLSHGAADRVKQLARKQPSSDPWKYIAKAEIDSLLEVLEPESPEVVAVVLSKLAVSQAAELLSRMPGERARRVAFAVSLTEGIAPAMVARIGASVADELGRRPPPAFATAPAARVGAILNSTPAPVRDALLDGLDEQDESFAEGVRKSIFTFGHIHERVNPRDVPKVLREVPQPELITALAAALPNPDSADGKSAEFLLANMSQRLAATLRDEVETTGKVKPKEAEPAMNAVVLAIRALADAGDITLLSDDDDDD